MRAQEVWDRMTGGEKDVLVQLTKVTWDGNLASKVGRTSLVNQGYVTQLNGFQVITYKGLKLLYDLGKLEVFTR